MSILQPKPSPLEPGYRLDRYELLCPIADGGMASVWIARLQGKHGFEKLLAIKTILPQYSSDPRFREMFLDEANIASGIEHANVAQILDLGEQHDVIYIVMEFVDGDALSKLHRAYERSKATSSKSRAGSSPSLAATGVWLRIVADTCAGLHAAHELCDASGTHLGVVHRDVSPQNIMITVKGDAKLIDFGVAKAAHRLADNTNSGNLKGKIQYMAPEQALGRQVDRRTDLWAIGAILYQLFAGHPPFESDNQLATLHLLASGRPPVPLGPEVPRPIAAIIRKALSHDARQRFATAAELKIALEGAMVEARCPTTSEDVAAFAAIHLADRTAARRDALELALDAATERSRMSGLLRPPMTDSSSSNGQTNIEIGVARVVRELARKSSPNVMDVATAGEPSSMEMLAAPIAETSSATLGSAAFDNSVSGQIQRVSSPSRGRTIAATFAGAATMIVVGFTVMNMPRSEAPGGVAHGVAPLEPLASAAARQPEPEIAPAPAAAPPEPTPLPTINAMAPSPPPVPIPVPPSIAGARAPVVAKPQPPPSPPRTRVVVAKPSPPPTPPPAPPPPPKKRTVDDGF